MIFKKKNSYKQYEAVVIEDSVNPYNGIRLTTLQLNFPRFILAEFNTHRMFSRNASSTRAIPTKKLIMEAWNNPVVPARYGSNIPGMQAGDNLTGWRRWMARQLWLGCCKAACIFALAMTKTGLHKQWAGRVIESWMWTSVVVTGTEWSNFFELRNHEDAQPEIKILAEKMKEAMDNSVPSKRDKHLPYITLEEKKKANLGEIKLEELIMCSVARCARVSYLTHDGKNPSREKDMELYTRLVGSEPIHASPTEHQAFAGKTTDFIKNFRGWKMHRATVEEVKWQSR